MLLVPIVEIYCDIDDFCNSYVKTDKKKLLAINGERRRDRVTVMSTSEIMTVLAAADKGYIDKKLEEKLFNQGLKLVTKVKKNMKKECSVLAKNFSYTNVV